MQTNPLNSDKATISGHGNNTSWKGFLRWARLAAAGALVLALALACTTPTPETSEKTAIAPTERAQEMPAPTATTAPAIATSESAAEKTPEAATFEGTLRFIVVDGDDDSAARLAALNDQHGFESLFEARVGIESGVSAIAEIDMRDPAGRVMVRLKKDIPAGQTQPSEMSVKDLALSTETEAVIYQNEAEGLVFFWTESLGQVHFVPATQEMVGEAVAAPMFDVRRDKTGDANWIKAVVGSDEQGASVYQLTHESDDRGNWMKLANPITVLERETIFAEAGEVAEVAEPIDWEVAMNLLFNGYEVVDSKGVIRKMPGYDFDHPVFDETDSEGTRFSIYCEDTMYGPGQKPYIALSDELGGNATLVNHIKDWWRRYQKAYNQGMGGSKEGIEGPYITAIDPFRLRQFSGEVAPINPTRDKGEGAPLREIPFDLGNVSRVIFLRGISRREKPIDMGDRFLPVVINGERLDVYNATATVDSGNNISTAFVFPDLDDPNKEKLILVFMNKGAGLEEGDVGTYGHLGRLVDQISYLFLPIDQVSKLTNNALGGSGRSLESQYNYSGDIQMLENKTTNIRIELADYYMNFSFR